MDREVDSYLRRKYEASIRDIEVVHKEDLDLVGFIDKSQSNACRLSFCLSNNTVYAVLLP